MPLQLDIKRKFTINSDRVKCVDQHPTEPWILCALYSGEVYIWNYETLAQIKKITVCKLPVRTAKFVSRKNWLITGSDDKNISVFNYNVLEKIHHFKAHSDYIRCIAVHPSQPIILSCGDDKLIKMWNWESKWSCQVFKSHTHYVMHVVFNPNDNNTFASASLDGTVNVWRLKHSKPNFSLKGHEKGVNCVDYYHGSDKPYLVTGSDDCHVRIWDYQNKVCIQTLKSHTKSVSAVAFHPKLPILFTGAEDGTVKLWQVGVFTIENSLEYGFDRVWSISLIPGSDNAVFGYDQGCVMISLGKEKPTITMDVKNYKIVQAKHFELQQVIIKHTADIGNGEIIPIVSAKDFGPCEIYPHSISFNPNNRFIAVCGNNEFIIYSAMGFKKKAFGFSQQVVWSSDGSQYAILPNSNDIQIYENFKDIKFSFSPKYGVESIYGGFLLGVKSMNGGKLSFYDWENFDLIRRIDIVPNDIYWSESGEYVCLSDDQTYYILRFSIDAVECAKEFKTMSDDGIKDAFKVINEIKETVKSGLWIGHCFVYTNPENKINYYVGGEIINIVNTDRPLFLLGYHTKDHKLYLSDKDLNIVSYLVIRQEFEFHTAVMDGDLETAEHLYYFVPFNGRLKLAQFLEKRGHVELAMHISTDPVHRFNIAISIGDLISAKYLAEEATLAEGSPSKISEERWSRLGALAAKSGEMELTKRCYKNARDYSALLLYAVSSGDKALLEEIAKDSAKEGMDNISFMSYFTLNNLSECLKLLLSQNKLAEAALFARTYMPSKCDEVSELLKKNTNKYPPSDDLAHFRSLLAENSKSDKHTSLHQLFRFQHYGEFKNLLQNAFKIHDEFIFANAKEELEEQGIHEDTSSDDEE